MQPSPQPRNTDHMKPESPQQRRERKRKELLKSLNFNSLAWHGFYGQEPIANLLNKLT